MGCAQHVALAVQTIITNVVRERRLEPQGGRRRPSPPPSVSPQVLRDILKEVQGNMVPRSMLKEWALHTFPNATDYWTFRKMFTIQLALIGLAEFMLHLNRLNPEMLQIAQVRGGTGALGERGVGTAKGKWDPRDRG